MRTPSFSLRNIFIATLLCVVLLCSGAQIAFAQTDLPPIDDSGGAATANVPAGVGLQNPASNSCIPYITFEFTKCIGAPLSQWSSSVMLTFGGGILRFAGALFDFGVNHVIIDFKDTLETKTPLMTVINAGWTFFRDIANIMIIGIFVFIAISLILGLTEYGQKKLVARVLIIAVLLNFSLLFTKIIIDASNFTAYAIYTQTAGAGGTTFSVADKVLAPLHITGVWDTTNIAKEVYAQQGAGAGAVKTLVFGFFGFLILTLLAAVIFYGAFLIIARAIMFILLMLTAPLAYASYLSPHFEASQFGWGNWWRSLINNAAFAPLLMIFLSISILIMQSASPSAQVSYGAFFADPSREVLADGWQILFLYIIGTGLLYSSFRMSSSLAGSISGIKAGQMLAGLPLIGGALGAGYLGQQFIGRNAARRAQGMAGDLENARAKAAMTGLKSDWAAFEKIRKQKASLEKRADSSFNLMNTRLGKAFAGSAGLKGAGETKGGFTTKMNEAAKGLDEQAKARQLSEENKKAIRKEAEDAIAGQYGAEAKDKAAAKDAAEKEMEMARQSMEAMQKEVVAAEQQRAAREPEAQEAHREVERVTQDVSQQKSTISAGYEKQIAELKQAVARAPEAGRQAVTERLARAEAEHKSALDAQDNRIKEARSKVIEIDRPLTEAQGKFAAAQKLHEDRKKVTARARKEANDVSSMMTRETKKLQETKFETAQKGVKKGIEQLTESYTDKWGGGHEGAHIIAHNFEKYTKSESPTSVLKDIQKSLKTNSSTPPAGDAH